MANVKWSDHAMIRMREQTRYIAEQSGSTDGRSVIVEESRSSPPGAVLRSLGVGGHPPLSRRARGALC